MKLDAQDRSLLNRLQARIPLTAEPWQAVGEELGLKPGEVLERLKGLKEQGVVRRIGGVFNPAGLGYAGRLYAMEVEESRFYQAAAVVNGFKGVTHNYRRRHRLNMWFTLSARSEEERETILGPIREAAGYARLYEFPSEQVFKLNVFLNMEGNAEKSSPPLPGSLERVSLSPRRACETDELDLRIIRELQGDMPLLPDPFAEVADRAGCGRDEVLIRLERLQATGVLKRVAAVLRHRVAGFSANGLFVAVLPQETIREAGQRLAGFKEVSHCYQRRSYPDWPYNLYAMIHASEEAEVQRVVREFVKEAAVEAYDILFSTEELKKTSWSL
ncbi:siroheme decarboxylase subunit beta [Paenibacillus sp. TH7-28]